MRMAPVTVMGAGVAGLATALMLARSGRRVVVLERDPVDVGAPEQAPDWPRKGIPHFHQPHAFIPRGRAELRKHLPDVYEALLAAGAYDVDLRPKLPGPTVAADEELQYLAVRRPLIEWALRRAVLADKHVDVRSGVHVTGLGIDRGRITSVVVDGSSVDAGLVVDALGRRSPTAAWTAEAEGSVEAKEASDCGVLYYCRYYRVRPGCELPDGPWFLSPRGDLGYFGFSSFPGDNGTFASVLAIPPRAREWRVLKDERPFEAAIAQIPALRTWVDPALTEPITDVMAMAGLTNTLRTLGPHHPVGLFPVGDAFSHTDPVLAHGLAFALVHAAQVVAAIEDNPDAGDAVAAYEAAASPALRERFALATALDAQRQRMWMGEQVDFTHSDGDYALFSMLAAGAAATRDVEVARAFLRRIGLLDSTAVLDGNDTLQRRIEELFADMRAQPRPAAGPSREDMLTVVTAAAGERMPVGAP